LLVHVINVLGIDDDPVKPSIRLLDDGDGLAVDVSDGVIRVRRGTGDDL
jgi:hypothetical protein